VGKKLDKINKNIEGIGHYLLKVNYINFKIGEKIIKFNVQWHSFFLYFNIN